jgi:hypothetical protein
VRDAVALHGDDVLLEFAWLDDAERHTYVAGGPPSGADEVAVPEAVAAILRLQPGDPIVGRARRRTRGHGCARPGFK